MANILCSPSKYVQGAGEMKKLGEYAQKYGKKALRSTEKRRLAEKLQICFWQ